MNGQEPLVFCIALCLAITILNCLAAIIFRERIISMRDDEIKRAWNSHAYFTKNWLEGKTEVLPVPVEEED